MRVVPVVKLGGTCVSPAWDELAERRQPRITLLRRNRTKRNEFIPVVSVGTHPATSRGEEELMSPTLLGRRAAIGVPDGALREALRKTLEREGMVVSSSATAADLLSGMGTRRDEVCILDADLAGSGLDRLIRRIRELLPAVPIILVSAHILSEPVIPEGLHALHLPFRRGELLDLLQRLLIQVIPGA